MWKSAIIEVSMLVYVRSGRGPIRGESTAYVGGGWLADIYWVSEPQGRSRSESGYLAGAITFARLQLNF